MKDAIMLMKNIAHGGSVMIEFILIFLAKIVEVSLMTLRTVFLTKGEKILASCIGFVEVLIWLIVVSNVLTDVQNDPGKMIVYALGFAVGCYVGTILEEKLALGLLTLQVIVGKEEGIDLAKHLRSNNIGVTVVQGEGKDNPRTILMVHIKRKNKDRVLKLIEEKNVKSVISITETKMVRGGYGLIRK